jgi:hypothetical protein
MSKAFKWLGAWVALCAFCFIVNKSCSVADQAIDAAPVRYEEYQEIYNTCEKISQDICNLKDVPATDPMFTQFSKEQRLLALRTNLNRWVNEYNGKSKMITRSLFKSGSLPYQLDTKQFSCN